ncbi:hypothetical protein FAM09_13970 [Niastella caeni]|uniref:Uncharacterized protein n=1 Tax=Niastella caeni TaxID=2569763 RepID=A0A4S8HVE4_9BACT|nr:hypothetical protein [Niastella caeni]THU39603.1 hypothetical protein FAM09_13970 [Niastella caeni]
MLFQSTIPTIPFKHWLYKDRENQRFFWFALVTIAASFIWLKIIYPFPNFMPPDSYNYLESAYNNELIGIWPIGYSKFLQLVGLFSHSHVVLVIVQFIILQASLLYLLFTIRYILSPGKWLFRIIFTGSILNPLLPHIANFVSSDCLFTALSIIWCTQLLWIIYRPSRDLLLTHAVVLLFAFMVRYNALYYPFISTSIIIFNRMSKTHKMIGIVSIAMLLLAFIGRTQFEYNKKTGVVQYTAFGGWQIAANALYGYAFSNPDPVEDVPGKFRPLHSLVNRHMDSLAKVKLRPDREIGIYYLWDFKSPLRIYMEQSVTDDTVSFFLKKWASKAPLYASYGKYLVLRHPQEFTIYYLWPNLKRYYSPPSYFMGIYNMGFTTVDPIAVRWFQLKSNRLYTRNVTMQISIADIFSVIIPIINLVFVTGFLSFVGLAGFKKCTKTTKRIIWCVIAIWVINTIFSVLSAPIELRYQLFPLIISLIWAKLFVANIIRIIWTTEKKHSK